MTVRERPQPWETVRDMQKLHGSGGDSERQLAIMRDSERLVELHGTVQTVRDSKQP